MKYPTPKHTPAIAAYLELLGRAMYGCYCPFCYGVGYTLVNGKHRFDCPVCDGTGKRKAHNAT